MRKGFPRVGNKARGMGRIWKARDDWGKQSCRVRPERNTRFVQEQHYQVSLGSLSRIFRLDYRCDCRPEHLLHEFFIEHLALPLWPSSSFVIHSYRFVLMSRELNLVSCLGLWALWRHEHVVLLSASPFPPTCFPNACHTMVSIECAFSKCQPMDQLDSD